MKLLEERILRDGVVRPGGILKVDSFLNHQMDIELINELGKEFFRLFGDLGVNKIITIEASGIGIACIVAQYFRCPVVFAKKSRSANISDEFWTAQVKSFTYGRVYDIVLSKEYLGENDRVLLIDDFLAKGEALNGMISLVSQSGAKLLGAGICIEKADQGGGDRIRSMGIRVESLARIASFSVEDGIRFC